VDSERSDYVQAAIRVLLARPRVESDLPLVAVASDTIAAFIYARVTEPDEHANRRMLADYPYRRVHVEALGTADAFQRRGLATQLVEAVEAWVRERGARAITAETYLDSPVSIPFWERRIGYRRRSVKLTKRSTRTRGRRRLECQVDQGCWRVPGGNGIGSSRSGSSAATRARVSSMSRPSS
jgi:GNAT superfamily N-acetyltransferase